MEDFKLTAMHILPIAVAAVVGAMSAMASKIAATLEDEDPLLPAMARMAASVSAPAPGWTIPMAAALAGLVLALFAPHQYVAMSLFLIFAVPACVFDLELNIIPEEMTWGLLFVGALASPWNMGTEDAVIAAAMATGAIWISMALIEYTTGKNTRSGGDIAAAAAGGAWVGVANSGVYLFTVCVVFVASVGILRHDEESWTPMGPALLAAIPLAPLLTPLLTAVIAG